MKGKIEAVWVERERERTKCQEFLRVCNEDLEKKKIEGWKKVSYWDG